MLGQLSTCLMEQVLDVLAFDKSEEGEPVSVPRKMGRERKAAQQIMTLNWNPPSDGHVGQARCDLFIPPVSLLFRLPSAFARGRELSIKVLCKLILTMTVKGVTETPGSAEAPRSRNSRIFTSLGFLVKSREGVET